MLRVDDTALAMTDGGGAGQPVVYVNGAFSSQRAWRRVITDLGASWRHITFDMRGRGRSRRSSDYSFDAAVRDLGAVLDATEVDRPILVGWSYGAAVALHWAAQRPSRTHGLVLVDGGYPYAWVDDDARTQIRRQFRRMRWTYPVLRRLGMAGWMSAEEHAEVSIEANEVMGALDGRYDAVTCPVRFIAASGSSVGGTDSEFARMRATLDPVLARNPDVRLHATVPSNHVTILRKDFRTVAGAIRDTAADRGHRTGT
ncbi:alpha/beta fold hydrolase [Amycolatopsis anabasis]|uniref:alpha/beta fold hydrolase n=1 Tax=Amycolatopsis anabasis TaxID=1840409 RepID=UPI00131CACFA|nr:alpha/beta hydrolase [Amycolatopsis anabasis]